MGIPSYFSHIVNKYKKIIKQRNEMSNIDNLFMDSNSIIYDVVHSLKYEDYDSKSSYEEAIIEQVIHSIEDYIESIKPSNIVYIAFDGVAPLAKMKQQRERRYRSDFINNHEFMKSFKKPSLWSSANITPGTDFMIKLSKHITKHFDSKEEEFHVKKIICSTSLEEGEGEHKIFHYIRQHGLDKNQKMVLYGLDADLIMLSIFNHELQRIYITREAPVFMKTYETKELLFMDVDLLCHYIISSMSCKYSNSYRLYDYVFMCFLLGNDFLPHFPSINIRTHGIDILLEVYNQYIGNYPDRYLVQNGKIMWRWVRVFLEVLAKNEYTYLSQEYAFRENNSKRGFYQNDKTDEEYYDYVFNSLPVMYNMEEGYINIKEKSWEKRYYNCLFHQHSSDLITTKDICINYLEGIEWVYFYYIGKHVNWDWKYNYSYPPLMKDLCMYLPHFDTQFLEPNNNKYSALFQLAYVLPESQYGLLPSHVQQHIYQNFPEIVGKYSIVWAFCRYFWESHVVFPHIKTEKLDTINMELLCL